MLLLQDSKPIIYVKRNQIFFIYNLAILDKIMQINGIANAMTTTSQKKLTHLVNYSKKLQV